MQRNASFLTKQAPIYLAISGVASYLCSYHFTNGQATENEKSTTKSSTNRKIIETNLMEKIANKPYLQPLGSTDNENYTRPKSVPDKMRVLVIDVPEFRHVFDEECKVDLSHIFPDGIAPPKRVTVVEHAVNENEAHDSNQSKRILHSATIEVVQKSFARSIARCGKKEGVILLEASVGDLAGKTFPGENKGSKNADNATKNVKETDRFSQLNQEVKIEESKYSNQYAWIEELRMRINGRIPFDDVLERSSLLSMYIFGNVYQWKTPWIDLRFWKSSRDKKIDVNCMKPHAVIADGVALASVPGALNELVSSCRTSDVPLWVINDPDDLLSAATSMRRDIRQRVIRDALNALQSETFERGRKLGNAEADARNFARNSAATAKRLVQNLKRDSWKDYTEEDIKRELIRRGICFSFTDELGHEPTNKLSCSTTFVELCHSIIANQESSIENESEVNGITEEEKGVI